MGLKIQIADKDTQLQVARKNHELGALRFILLRGLLLWALPMAVFCTVFEYFAAGYHGAITIPGLEHTAMICAVVGLLVGIALWVDVCRRVRRSNAE